MNMNYLSTKSQDQVFDFDQQMKQIDDYYRDLINKYKKEKSILQKEHEEILSDRNKRIELLNKKVENLNKELQVTKEINSALKQKKEEMLTTLTDLNLKLTGFDYKNEKFSNTLDKLIQKQYIDNALSSISQLENEIKKLNNKKDYISDKINKNKSKINKYDVQLNEKKMTYSKIKNFTSDDKLNLIAENKVLKSQQDKIISSLEKFNDELEMYSDIKELIEKLTNEKLHSANKTQLLCQNINLEHKIDIIQNENENLQKILEKNTETINNLNKEIEIYSANSIAEDKEKQNFYQKQIIQLRNDISKQQNLIDKQKLTIYNNDLQITKLKNNLSENENLKLEIETLQNEKRNYDNQINSYLNQIHELEKQLSFKQKDFNELNETKTEIKSLRKEKNILQMQLDNATNELHKLEQEVISLQEKEKELELLKKQFSQLKKGFNFNEKKINELENIIDKKEQYITLLENKSINRKQIEDDFKTQEENIFKNELQKQREEKIKIGKKMKEYELEIENKNEQLMFLKDQLLEKETLIAELKLENAEKELLSDNSNVSNEDDEKQNIDFYKTDKINYKKSNKELMQKIKENKTLITKQQKKIDQLKHQLKENEMNKNIINKNTTVMHMDINSNQNVTNCLIEISKIITENETYIKSLSKEVKQNQGTDLITSAPVILNNLKTLEKVINSLKNYNDTLNKGKDKRKKKIGFTEPEQNKEITDEIKSKLNEFMEELYDLIIAYYDLLTLHNNNFKEIIFTKKTLIENINKFQNELAIGRDNNNQLIQQNQAKLNSIAKLNHSSSNSPIIIANLANLYHEISLKTLKELIKQEKEITEKLLNEESKGLLLYKQLNNVANQLRNSGDMFNK